jgi:hypothetical protein
MAKNNVVIKTKRHYLSSVGVDIHYVMTMRKLA